MYSTYDTWLALCKKLFSRCNKQSCVGLSKQHRAMYFHCPDGSADPLALSIVRKNQKADLARQEQMSVVKEIAAAREIAHHCRRNNGVYSQLQELSNRGFKVDLEKLSLVQRMFLENRYIFEAIAKHIRVNDLFTEVQIYGGLDQLVSSSKSQFTPQVLRHLVEYLLGNEYHERPRVYTDASKSVDGRCGIGVYDESNDIRIMLQLRLDTSIMTAETLAIKVAMQHVNSVNLQRAVLLTDSQPACIFLKKAKNSRMRNSVANEILQLAQRNRTAIQWIPGHIQLPGNEIADQLAREALQADFILENNIFVNDAISYFEERKAILINKWYQEYIRHKGKSLQQLISGDDENDPHWSLVENYA